MSTHKAWSKAERHFRDLSEIYQFAYNEQITVAKSIMTLQGVFTEMYSELIKYQQKGGKNENAEIRLKTAIDHLQILSSLQTDNYILKHNIKKVNIANQKLHSKVNELEEFIHRMQEVNK